MPGIMLENLSGKKWCILSIILLVSQLACFLVGLIAPSPASSQGILATVCKDENPSADNINQWFTGNCSKEIDLSQEKFAVGLDAKNVFVMQMPRNDNVIFTPWHQNLVGILQVDLVYYSKQMVDPNIEVTLDVRLAYSDKTDRGRTPWKYYSHSGKKHYMFCTFEDIRGKAGYQYNCSMFPLFEFDYISHDYFLLNLRLPYDHACMDNTLFGKIKDIYLHVIHINDRFTKIWVSLKTFFFPVIVGIMIWFWQQVHKLNRAPSLLEYVLITLGGTLAFLNLPIEYLSLIFDMPFMLLLNSIRQGIFHAILLSFWLVFAGEHKRLIQDKGKKSNLKMYWMSLSGIVMICLCVLAFNFYNRGVYLINPFYSIWVTPICHNLALSFITLVSVCATMYFVFLCYMIWRAFKNISAKGAIVPNLWQEKRFHFKDITYRFNLVMVTTVVCAALTIISFILSHVSERQNKWDENLDLEHWSVWHTGVYGMWNLYVCTMLILYAPCLKKWPADPIVLIPVVGKNKHGNLHEITYEYVN